MCHNTECWHHILYHVHGILHGYDVDDDDDYDNEDNSVDDDHHHNDCDDEPCRKSWLPLTH